MSGHTVPADFSEHMLDLDEDEDLEVFTKVTSAAAGLRFQPLLKFTLSEDSPPTLTHTLVGSRGSSLARVCAGARGEELELET